MFVWTGKFEKVIFDDEANCMFGQESITDELEAKLIGCALTLTHYYKWVMIVLWWTYALVHLFDFFYTIYWIMVQCRENWEKR